MENKIQTNATGQITPCFQHKINKTTYLVEAHFSDTSRQTVEDRLKHVILHDLEYGKKGKNQEI